MLLTTDCLAARPLEVIINEIAWMGTVASANDEWFEFYNQTEQKINLEGWQLKAQDNSPTINLKGEIASQGFFIFERTDDTTLPTIKADLIYTGSLKNTGETLLLFDPNNNLIDQVRCQDGWFSGDNETKQTMERIDSQDAGEDPGSWQTSQDPGGTPGQKNSSGFIPLPKPIKQAKENQNPSSPAKELNISNQQAKEIIQTNQNQLLAGINPENRENSSLNSFLKIALVALIISCLCLLVVFVFKGKFKHS